MKSPGLEVVLGHRHPVRAGVFDGRQVGLEGLDRLRDDLRLGHGSHPGRLRAQPSMHQLLLGRPIRPADGGTNASRERWRHRCGPAQRRPATSSRAETRRVKCSPCLRRTPQLALRPNAYLFPKLRLEASARGGRSNFVTAVGDDARRAGQTDAVLPVHSQVPAFRADRHAISDPSEMAGGDRGT